MDKNNLIVELGTEELPPKALKTLAESFCQNTEQLLVKAGFGFEEIRWYAAPRRLALYVKQLDAQQPDRVVEKKGPAESAAFDETGSPSKAALGWAKSCGITVEEAQRLTTDKGTWLLHKATVAGKSLKAELPAIVSQALSKLPIPKPMRWGSKTTQFIRPVHTLCMLFGNALIEGEVLGVKSSNVIRGHRFHADKPVVLCHADSYLETLEKAYVIADFGQRRAKIQSSLSELCEKLNAQVTDDDDLLDEVTALVEWPVVLTAEFDAKFLTVPKEALIYTMKDDQKYFPLLDQDGNLLSTFAFVSNIESKDSSVVTKGNERVIRPRLADAEFFFNTDKKTSLESRLTSLDSILFQKQLGTVKDKAKRIASLSEYLAKVISADSALAKRAGLLAKTDLVSNMVMEFPDVQGSMGKHYALNDGENPQVAEAIEQQYKPKFSGDTLPSDGVSQSVAMADKIDTLVGIFGIGQIPKGDKDPFALRRAAIGLLRIIIENNIRLDLKDVVAQAVNLFGSKLTSASVEGDVIEFILSRLKSWYQDKGVSSQIFQAVMYNTPTDLLDFDARIDAVRYFANLEAAEPLSAANKRVANILAKNSDLNTQDVDTGLFTEAAESSLYENLQSAKEELKTFQDSSSYQQILERLASLRGPIDSFFDSVMVMADDEKVKLNRLALLKELRQLFLVVADISVLGK
ncbi:glycine--tRNA ligase subunit beta [Alteromonadaceae bacterium M269]|nr:glycine--tRNA ligase subunit beta [Alteromonadaceae bacterium M269]